MSEVNRNSVSGTGRGRNQLLALFNALERELDVEYRAANRGDLSALITTRLRQNDIMARIDRLQTRPLRVAAGRGSHPNTDPNAENSPLLRAIHQRLMSKIERNRSLCQKQWEEVSAELASLSARQNFIRKNVAKYLQQNASEFFDLRR